MMNCLAKQRILLQIRMPKCFSSIIYNIAKSNVRFQFFFCLFLSVSTILYLKGPALSHFLSYSAPRLLLLISY